MTTNTRSLSKEAIALIHHIELNKAGWKEKTIQRLVMAAVWLEDAPASSETIRARLEQEFHLHQSSPSVEVAIERLLSENLLIKMPNSRYNLPNAVQQEFEQQVDEAMTAESSACEFFLTLADAPCLNSYNASLWEDFKTSFLIPLIASVGANAYKLIVGDKVTLHEDILANFLALFPSQAQEELRKLVPRFLNPKVDAVRAYVIRLLHARFCIEAVGLPQNVIDALNIGVGKHVNLRMFVDTNFLFSLLELHENPSNDAAKELQELITHLRGGVRIKLLVTTRTIEEAKSVINAAKFNLSQIPLGLKYTNAALSSGVSGLAQKYFAERARLDGALTAASWFDPYLQSFVPIARGKGIEPFNEDLSMYSMRQDVVDDITELRASMERLPEKKQKSYESVAHDMILWHFVNDKRPAYIESPLDAEDWILTIDFRFIAFDAHKRRDSRGNMPICVHPTSLVQMLQFWVPRDREFEEASLSSLRFPFLFQAFDPEAERTTLKILAGMGRFESHNEIPEAAITGVLTNQNLRLRMEEVQENGGEISLIRDALLEEANARALANEAKVKEVQHQANEEQQRLVESIAEKEKEIERERHLRNETERTASKVQQAAEAKSKKASTREERLQVTAGFIVAILIVLLFLVAANLVPAFDYANYVKPWPIQVGCCALFFFAALGAFVSKWRNWCWGTAVFSLFLLLITMFSNGGAEQ